MRTLHFTMVAVVIAFILTGCTTCGQSPTQVASNYFRQQSIVTTTKENYPAKKPENIAFYTPNQTPKAAYRVIGVAKISKYNLLGSKREEQAVHDMMKNLAASIGGDGIIDIKHTNDAMQANVITMQKILI